MGEFCNKCLSSKNTPHFTILTRNALSELKVEPDNSINYVFEQILNDFFNFESLPPLISALNPKFRYAAKIC